MRDDKLLSRIGALLRQAEGTDNEHEAQTFMQAAQRLATAASIDLAVARSHDPAGARTAPEVRQVAIGPAGKRGLRTYVALFVAIAHANDVKVDVAHNSTFVLAYGFGDDVDVIEALYSSLVVQMVAASDAYLASGEYRSQVASRVVVDRSGWRTRRRVEHTPLAPITARLNFQSAFADRIGARLTQAREAARAEALARESDDRATTSTQIALRDKDVAVVDFHRSESTARGTWRETSGSAGYSDSARRAGDRAGRRARIGESERLGGARGAIGSG